MQSSSSASGSDSEMFPATRIDYVTAQPQTGDMPSYSLRALSSGISPPTSQTNVRRNSDSGEAEPNNIHLSGNGDAEIPASSSKRVEDDPGWVWKNPKAREEYDRSMEVVLDRGFSMRDFGEPFDDEILANLEMT